MTRHPGWGCGISGPLDAAAECPCGALPAFLAWQVLACAARSNCVSPEEQRCSKWGVAGFPQLERCFAVSATTLAGMHGSARAKVLRASLECPTPAVVPSHYEAMHLGGILATATRSESLCTACHNASSNSSGSLSTCSRTRRSHPWPSNLMRMDSANSLQPLPGRP